MVKLVHKQCADFIHSTVPQQLQYQPHHQWQLSALLNQILTTPLPLHCPPVSKMHRQQAYNSYGQMQHNTSSEKLYTSIYTYVRNLHIILLIGCNHFKSYLQKNFLIHLHICEKLTKSHIFKKIPYPSTYIFIQTHVLHTLMDSCIGIRGFILGISRIDSLIFPSFFNFPIFWQEVTYSIIFDKTYIWVCGSYLAFFF